MSCPGVSARSRMSDIGRVHSAPPAPGRHAYPASPPPAYEEVLKQPRLPPPSYDEAQLLHARGRHPAEQERSASEDRSPRPRG